MSCKNNAEVIWAAMERMQGKIAAEIRAMLGEGPYAEKLFTDEERQRRIAAMQMCAAAAEPERGDTESQEDYVVRKAAAARARHDAWVEMHREKGYVYGEQFNPEASPKTHPNMLPWDELPAAVKHKAEIFDIVARETAKLVEALTCK